MAYKLIDEIYCPYTRSKRKEFICDTDADVANLPKSCAGSTALVVESGKYFMVNASGEWAEFGGN